jgi:signal transduction histidine kinase
MKFRSKLFLSHLLSIIVSLSLISFLIYKQLKKTITEQYVERYQSVNEVVAETLVQLEKSSELLSKTAIEYLYEFEKAGLPGRKTLKNLRDKLNVGLIAITDKEGRFLRNTQEEVHETPKSIFLFCEGYRDLLNGKNKMEQTPILPSSDPSAPYKFTMIPNQNGNRILEVGIQMRYIGEVLQKTLLSDKNIKSIGLMSPNGRNLGNIVSGGKAIFGTDHKIETVNLKTGFIIGEGSNLIIIKKVNAPSSQCCECIFKDVAGEDGTYYYLLRTEVSITPLMESINILRNTILAFLSVGLLLALWFSQKLSQVLTREIDRLNVYVRKVISSGKLEESFEVKGEDEVAELGQNFSQMIKVVDKSQKEILLAEKHLSVAQTARQVAHDIRSPLTVLEWVNQNNMNLPEDIRILSQSATSRIKDIAHNLLEMEKISINSESSSQMLSEIVEVVISEKRIKGEESIQFKIKEDLNQHSYHLFSSVNRSDLARVLSNILNNAIEATTKDGVIEVSLFDDHNGYAVISIKDNGKGIPQEILPRVSENGFSFEKPHGSGLGLYHAQKVINSFGGRLQITSEINLGTEVQIKLPLSQPPAWFLPFVELNHFEQVVVIDDDDSIHKIWSSRIKIPLKHFYDFKEAQKWTLTNRSAIDKSLFFVDYEIQSQTMTGLDFILENNLLKNAYLITGRYSEKEIIKKCLENKIKLIPKKLAGIIPLHSNEF